MSNATTVDFVRELINDKNSESAAFSDADIKDALKPLRWEARWDSLDALKSIASGGVTTYLTFVASENWGYWDTDTTIYDSNYDVITPTSADYTIGRWVVASEPTRPVRVLGFSNDPYGAAAALLTQRASQLAEDIQSFSSANGSFSYNNKRQGPLELAALYLAKSRSATGGGELYRSDTNIF